MTGYKKQKDLAAALDYRASKSDGWGEEGATSKQCWYLAGLIIATCKEADVEHIISEAYKGYQKLTKYQASKWIDNRLQAQKEAA